MYDPAPSHALNVSDWDAYQINRMLESLLLEVFEYAASKQLGLELALKPSPPVISSEGEAPSVGRPLRQFVAEALFASPEFVVDVRDSECMDRVFDLFELGSLEGFDFDSLTEVSDDRDSENYSDHGFPGCLLGIVYYPRRIAGISYVNAYGRSIEEVFVSALGQIGVQYLLEWSSLTLDGAEFVSSLLEGELHRDADTKECDPLSPPPSTAEVEPSPELTGRLVLHNTVAKFSTTSLVEVKLTEDGVKYVQSEFMPAGELVDSSTWKTPMWAFALMSVKSPNGKLFDRDSLVLHV